MSEITQAEKYLLAQIRQGDSDAWTQLVERYQGRLAAFARARIPQAADAEDIVQDTFVAFLKGVDKFRGEAGLETYLFTILRHKIADCYRGRWTRDICLLQDIYQTDRQESNVSDAFGYVAGSDPTASTYARRDEQHDIQRQGLAEALRELINSFKKSLNFRDLQIVELLFYCQLTNQNIGKIMEFDEKNIAVIKHRCLKKVREAVDRLNISADAPAFENLLTEVWEGQRLSCPKRSTIGAYLLKTLDKQWYDYVDFHVNKLGCRFCRANLDDLQEQNTQDDTSALRNRIMESTLGFLHKP